jgi:signal transduction histidine kinase
MSLANRRSPANDSALIEGLSASLLAQLSIALIFIDREGTVLWANDKLTAIAGLDNNYLRGKVFYDQPEFQKDQLCEAVKSAMDASNYENSIRPAESFSRPFGKKYRAEVKPIMVGQKTVAGAIIFWELDGSLPQQSEADKSKGQLSAVLSLCDDRIIVIDQSFIIQLASNATLHHLGNIPIVQIKGRVCYRALFKADKPCPHCPALPYFEKKGKEQNREKRELQNATQASLTLEAIPILNDREEVYEAVVNCFHSEDIKRFELSSKEKAANADSETAKGSSTGVSEVPLRLIEAIPSAAIMVNFENNIIDCNQVALGLADFERKETLGSNLFKAFPRFDDAALREKIRLCFDTGFKQIVIQQAPGLGSRKSSRLKHTISKVPDDSGIKAVLIIIEDDSEPAFSERNGQSADKYDTLCRFASRLSHDINNPLAVLMNQLDVLRSEDLSDIDSLERFQNEVDVAQRQVNRILTIIESVSALQSHTADDVSIANLQLITERASIIAHFHRPFKGVGIEIEPIENLPPIYCCEVRLERALTELFKNALEAAGETGKVTVGTKYDDEEKRFIIRIRDTGMGIPPENMSKIFDAFFTTKVKGPKTVGLGLTIAYAAIVSHDGTLQIISEPQKGTEAIVILPLAPSNFSKKAGGIQKE